MKSERENLSGMVGIMMMVWNDNNTFIIFQKHMNEIAVYDSLHLAISFCYNFEAHVFVWSYTSLLHSIHMNKNTSKTIPTIFSFYSSVFTVCIFSIAFLIRLDLTLVFLLGKFHRMHFKHVWGAKRASDEVWDKKKERKRVRMSDKWNREPKKWKKHKTQKNDVFMYVQCTRR